MDPDQSGKFAIHEAAREGKSMYVYLLLHSAIANFFATIASVVESLLNVSLEGNPRSLLQFI